VLVSAGISERAVATCPEVVPPNRCRAFWTLRPRGQESPDVMGALHVDV
jgi:hypothetical protein